VALEHLRPRGPYEGEALLLRRVPTRAHQRERLANLQAASVAAVLPAQLAQLSDGRLDTSWNVPATAARGAWLELRWTEAQWLTRLELVAGLPARPGLNLHVQIAPDGVHFEPWPWLPGRPPLDQQVAALGAPSEVLLGAPRELRALRIERRLGARPWSIAELRVWVRATEGSVRP
jgi:hypothetical protein